MNYLYKKQQLKVFSRFLFLLFILLVNYSGVFAQTDLPALQFLPTTLSLAVVQNGGEDNEKATLSVTDKTSPEVNFSAGYDQSASDWLVLPVINSPGELLFET